jgi:hypothetical protein
MHSVSGGSQIAQKSRLSELKHQLLDGAGARFNQNNFQQFPNQPFNNLTDLIGLVISTVICRRSAAFQALSLPTSFLELA